MQYFNFCSLAFRESQTKFSLFEQSNHSIILKKLSTYWQLHLIILVFFTEGSTQNFKPLSFVYPLKIELYRATTFYSFHVWDSFFFFFLDVVIFMKTPKTCLAPEVYSLEKKTIVVGGGICWVAQATSFWNSEGEKEHPWL